MIYFDHAATTPVSEEVKKKMDPYFCKNWGNPSSVYGVGREAREALYDCRRTVAGILGSDRPNEVIFTSGATESNNLALKGISFYASQKMGIKPHIIVSSIEHHSVLDVAKHLEKDFGFEVTYLSVSREGLVNPDEVQKSIKENTTIVSVMMGNNETGTIEPLKKIGLKVKAQREKRQKTKNKVPLVLHTDAVQAFAFLPINAQRLGVDLLSITAHKIYGPKGIGVLYVRHGTRFLPQQHGGAQELERRAGTEGLPQIVGMTEAMRLMDKNRDAYYKKTAEISDYLNKRITEEISETELLGPKDPENRLPHISNFIFRGAEGESILINLDILGFAASSGSACTSSSLEPSHVIKEMDYSDLESHGTVRFSLGELNEKSDVDELMKHLPGVVSKLRAMSPIEYGKKTKNTPSERID